MWFAAASQVEQQQKLASGLRLRNVSTVNAGPTGTIAGSRPAGAQPTDIFIAVFSSSTNPGVVVTVPSGWTNIPGATFNTDNGMIFSYWAPGTVTNFTFFVSQTGAGVAMAIFALSGADIVNPIRAASATSSGGTSISAPSVEAVAGDFLIHNWYNWQGAVQTVITDASTNIVTRFTLSNNNFGTIENLTTSGPTNSITLTAPNFQGKRAVTIAVAAASTSSRGYKSISSVANTATTTLSAITPPGALPSDMLMAVLTRAADHTITSVPYGWYETAISGMPDGRVKFYTANGAVQDLTWSWTGTQSASLQVLAFKNMSWDIAGEAVFTNTVATEFTSTSIQVQPNDSIMTVFVNQNRTLELPSPTTITPSTTIRSNVLSNRSTSTGPVTLITTEDLVSEGLTNSYTMVGSTSTGRYAIQLRLQAAKITVRTLPTQGVFSTNHSYSINIPSPTDLLIVAIINVNQNRNISNITDSQGGQYVLDSLVNTFVGGFYRRISGGTTATTTATTMNLTYSSDADQFYIKPFYLQGANNYAPIDSKTSGTTGFGFSGTPRVSLIVNDRNVFILGFIGKGGAGLNRIIGMGRTEAIEAAPNTNNLWHYYLIPDAGNSAGLTVNTGTWLQASSYTMAAVSYKPSTAPVGKGLLGF